MKRKRKKPKALFNLHEEIIYTLCWLGRYGSGKSLGMTKTALDIVEDRKLSIAANYYIDPIAVRRYAEAFGYPWLKHVRIVFEPDLENLFRQERAMILMDEAGTKIFARDFSKIPGEFFRLYNQIRKGGNYFMFAAQSIEQIDYQVEQLIEFYLECESMQKPDKKNHRARLIERYIWGFDQGGWAKSRTGLRRYNYFKRLFDSKNRRYQRNLPLKKISNYISEFFKYITLYITYYTNVRYRNEFHKQNSFYTHKITSDPNHRLISSLRKEPLLAGQLWRIFWKKYYRPVEEDYIFKIYDSFRFADENGKVYSRKHGYVSLEKYEQWLQEQKYLNPRQKDPNELSFTPEDFLPETNGNGNGLPTLKRKTMTSIIFRIAKEMKVQSQLPKLKNMNDAEIYKLYLELTLEGKILK